MGWAERAPKPLCLPDAHVEYFGVAALIGGDMPGLFLRMRAGT